MPEGAGWSKLTVNSDVVSLDSAVVSGSLDQVATQLAPLKGHGVAIILLWFALAVSPSWLPTPDSALYLMLGRSLAQGQGYTLFGQPHAYVPPGYPFFVAALDRAGLGSMLCLNIAMGLVGLLSVWMGYRLISQQASQPVSILIACLFGCNSLLHAISARQLSDTPFTLLVLAGLYFLLRGLRENSWHLELGTLLIVASCWVRLALRWLCERICNSVSTASPS